MAELVLNQIFETLRTNDFNHHVVSPSQAEHTQHKRRNFRASIIRVTLEEQHLTGFPLSEMSLNQHPSIQPQTSPSSSPLSTTMRTQFPSFKLPLAALGPILFLPSVLPSSNPEQIFHLLTLNPESSDSYSFQKMALLFSIPGIYVQLIALAHHHSALSLRVPLYLFYLDVQTLYFIQFNCSCLLQRAVCLNIQYIRDRGSFIPCS